MNANTQEMEAEKKSEQTPVVYVDVDDLLTAARHIWTKPDGFSDDPAFVVDPAAEEEQTAMLRYLSRGTHIPGSVEVRVSHLISQRMKSIGDIRHALRTNVDDWEAYSGEEQDEMIEEAIDTEFEIAANHLIQDFPVERKGFEFSLDQ